jgi:hypothetical protein
MSDIPKFEVIDRRKFKAAEEEKESHRADSAPEPQSPAAEASVPSAGPVSGPSSAPSSGPQLVVNGGRSAAEPAPAEGPEAALDEPAEADLPPAPTAQESREQKAAYDASALRLEEIVRAQNPAVGAQPVITFEHLVQQLYVSAMIQMGAGAQDGQRPRVDILGARTTIDLLGVLAEKTKGNLTPAEERALQTVLFEVRMAFLELTSMINLQAMQPPQPPPPGKR